MMVVLVAVAVFVTMRPTLGTTIATHRPTQRKTVLVLLLSAGLIGLYDGLLGPGTGTFLIISFATFLGTEFVRSAAMAKVINLGSNFGALAYFAVTGHVWWSFGFGDGGVQRSRRGHRFADGAEQGIRVRADHAVGCRDRHGDSPRMAAVRLRSAVVG